MGNMEELLEQVYVYCATYGLNIIAAFLIFFIGKWVAKIASNILKKVLEKAHFDKTLTSFVAHLVYAGCLVVVFVAALSKLGVETTSIVAMVGAAGLAVGLALQGALANFAAGVILILFQPFKVGHVVEIDGQVGTVSEIQIFNTVIHTLDNRKLIFPNAKVTGDTITNLSGVDERRIDLVFGISYTDNIKTAKEALERVLLADKRILKSPKPVVAVSELADSSVNLVCRPWVQPADYWNVYFDVVERGKLELEKSGITIPFPQRDVHMYQEK